MPKKKFHKATPISRLLLNARKAKKPELTQLELATILKYDGNSVSICEWEGARKPVPPSQFEPLAKALNIPLKTLLKAAADTNPTLITRYEKLRRRFSENRGKVDGS